LQETVRGRYVLSFSGEVELVAWMLQGMDTVSASLLTVLRRVRAAHMGLGEAELARLTCVLEVYAREVYDAYGKHMSVRG